MLEHDIDVEGLARDLDIENKAIQQGQMNQPGPGATEFDVPQRDIVQRIGELLDQARRESRDVLDSHKTRREQIEREMANLRIEDIPKEADSAIERAEHEHRPGLVKAREHERRMLREVRVFQARHKCRREPSYPDSFILHWAVVGGIVLAESIANSYFFAKGSDLGLLGGLFQALLISLVNVVPALLIGSRVLPYLHPLVDQNLRMAASAGLSLYGVLLLTFNLAVAHYRAVLESDPFTAIVQAIPNLIRSPFGINNLDAWILFGLGTVFAIIAMIKAFKADDPLPGYGRLHRAYKEAEANYLERRQAITTAINGAIDEHRVKADAMVATGQAHVREYSDLIDRSRAVCNDYTRHANALEEACNLLLFTYRAQNSEIRTANNPPYWNDKYSFGKHLRMALPDLKDEERNLEQFNVAVKDMRGKIGDTLDALRSLNSRKLEDTSAFFREVEEEAERLLKRDGPAPAAGAAAA
ncbi:hypothetical protein [Caenispirillum salinarum]|uniref:hypothetical protein n=1 Tax=Caenispirillum salinarum TaxID=859058 RepID=UPI00384FE9E8